MSCFKTSQQEVMSCFKTSQQEVMSCFKISQQEVMSCFNFIIFVVLISTNDVCVDSEEEAELPDITPPSKKRRRKSSEEQLGQYPAGAKTSQDLMDLELLPVQGGGGSSQSRVRGSSQSRVGLLPVQGGGLPVQYSE